MWWLAAMLAGGCGFNSSNSKAQPDAGGPVVDGAPPPMIDAPPTGTTPPGNAMCFGPTGWQVCLDAPPTGAITLTGALDTDKSDAANPCLKAQPATWTNALQPDACFIVADKITVTSLNATGKRPLVLVGGSSIAVQALLDVGSRRTGMPGAASQSTECQPFKRDPGTGGGGGGGAGGSFGGAGGNGGNGDDGNHQNGQSADADVGQPARLRGGCAGQPGGNLKAGDPGGGAGGGAVYLVSAGPIKITGTIDASGAGGVGGAPQNGGSGGGSGGLIVLYSPMSIGTVATTLIFATGGGGGGGGAASGLPVTAKGGDGQDPIVAVPVAIAAGGGGGQSSDGNGGGGGGGFPSASDALDATGGNQNAGGGGGGGGAGFVVANLGLAPAVVSPAAQMP